MAKFQIGIIYILRDKFQIYIPNHPSILEFRFLPEFIRDLDIVNKELLLSLLNLFITNNKIPQTSYIIIIADSASFIKDFLIPPQPTLEEAKKQSNEFLEHIPFEEVSSKTIVLPNGIRTYATNKDLYEVVREFLIKINSEVISVLPATIIGPGLHPSLDTSGINTILEKYPDLKEYNLTTQPIFQPTIDKTENTTTPEPSTEIETELPTETKDTKKQDKKTTTILIAVFVVLLIILVIVYITQPPL